MKKGNFNFNLNEADTVLCDIDGTIADLNHRRVYLSSKPKNYMAFKSKIMEDTPIQHIINTLKQFKSQGYKIVLCSGRGDDQRTQTEQWLEIHKVPWDAMFMRAEKDYRVDDIIKEELFDRILAAGYKPLLVLDDRDRVVSMWRRRGLLCVQVASGNF